MMSDLSPTMSDDREDNSPCLGGGVASWMDTVDTLVAGNRAKILDVIQRARTRDPNNVFVESCARQFEASGHLSEKQINALNRVTAYRRRRSMSFLGSDYSSRDDYGEGNSWDWAGGD